MRRFTVFPLPLAAIHAINLSRVCFDATIFQLCLAATVCPFCFAPPCSDFPSPPATVSPFSKFYSRQAVFLTPCHYYTFSDLFVSTAVFQNPYFPDNMSTVSLYCSDSIGESNENSTSTYTVLLLRTGVKQNHCLHKIISIIYKAKLNHYYIVTKRMSKVSKLNQQNT